MLAEERDIETLVIMRERGATWLASILESMLGGDPWQEGHYARVILEKYRVHELHMEPSC